VVGLFYAITMLIPLAIMLPVVAVTRRVGSMERGWFGPEESPEAHRALTRQELLLYAEELAVEVARWKAWCMEEKVSATIDEAQAIQALAMALIELLSGQQGSRATARAECARVTSFLTPTVPEVLAPREVPAQTLPHTSEPQRIHPENSDFLRTHRLRFDEDWPESPCT
jgi:hypothetical protein